MRQPLLSPGRAAAGAVALALALLGLAGCGSDDDEAEQSKAPSTAAEQAPVETAPADDTQTAPEQTPTVPEEQTAAARPRAPAAATRKDNRALRLERRERALAVANAMLPLLEIADSTVATAGGATTVVITLTARAACKLERGDDRRLSIAVRDALEFVKQVKLRAGPRRPLSAYRAERCPGAGRDGGRVVLHEQGRGFKTTAPFRISSRKWTIEYGYDKGFFRANVLRGSQLVRVIGAARGRLGKRELVGPGTFRLRIGAGGAWSVSVRQGG